MNNWEMSKRGGPKMSLPEAARLLGISDTHLRKNYKTYGLKPANSFNPIRKHQFIYFYVFDVQEIIESFSVSETEEQEESPASDGNNIISAIIAA